MNRVLKNGVVWVTKSMMLKCNNLPNGNWQADCEMLLNLYGIKLILKYFVDKHN